MSCRKHQRRAEQFGARTLNHQRQETRVAVVLSTFLSQVAMSDRLVGQVVKASSSRAEDPGFDFRSRRDFPGPSHTSGLKIGIPVATLPGPWRYRVSTGTGWPGVRTLSLGETESAARTTV